MELGVGKTDLDGAGPMTKYISTMIAILLITTYLNSRSIEADTHQSTADLDGDRVVLTGDDLSSWRPDTGAW